MTLKKCDKKQLKNASKNENTIILYKISWNFIGEPSFIFIMNIINISLNITENHDSDYENLNEPPAKKKRGVAAKYEVLEMVDTHEEVYAKAKEEKLKK